MLMSDPATLEHVDATMTKVTLAVHPSLVHAAVSVPPPVKVKSLDCTPATLLCVTAIGKEYLFPSWTEQG